MKRLFPLLFGLLGAFAAAAGASTDAPDAGRVPAKLAWAELITSGEPAAAASFYQEVFGWRVETTGRSYGARVRFFAGDRAVAGIAHRPAETIGLRRSRWVLFFAAPDVSAAAERAAGLGGALVRPVAPWPEGGEVALITDPEGALLGLLSASAGAPADYAAEPGEWSWPLLLGRRPDLAAPFYRDVLGVAVHDEARTPLFIGDFVLADGPRARAALMALPRDSSGRSGWLGLVRVADLPASVARARKAGGKILREPTADLIGGRIAVVEDPLGAVFALVETSLAAGPRSALRTPPSSP